MQSTMLKPSFSISSRAWLEDATIPNSKIDLTSFRPFAAARTAPDTPRPAPTPPVGRFGAPLASSERKTLEWRYSLLIREPGVPIFAFWLPT